MQNKTMGFDTQRLSIESEKKPTFLNTIVSKPDDFERFKNL
jgi:hypothetical protein